MNLHQLVLTTILLALVAPAASAAEAVGIEVLQDGKHIAGFTITHQGESEAELWMMLREVPLTFQRDFSIPVDADDSTKSALVGSIEVRVHRRGDAGAGITTDRLEFVRRGDRWFVTDADVERTLQAADSKIAATPSTAAKRQLSWTLVLCLACLLVAATLAVSFLFKSCWARIRSLA